MDQEQQPLVSTVIPVYNRLELLPATLDSLLAQTYSNLQIVVVDDGSREDIGPVIEPYRDRIELFRQSNMGVSAARNHGIAHSCGEFMFFLDADDLVHPDYVAKMTQPLLANQSLSVSYCNALSFEGDDPIAGTLENTELGDRTANPLSWLMSSNIPLTCIFFRKELLDRVGTFDIAVQCGEDWDVNIKLARYGKWIYVPETLFYYRQTGESASVNYIKMYNQPRTVLYKHADNFEGRKFWRREIQAYEYRNSLNTAIRIRKLLRSKPKGSDVAKALRFLASHPSMIPYMFRRYKKR